MRLMTLLLATMLAACKTDEPPPCDADCGVDVCGSPEGATLFCNPCMGYDESGGREYPRNEDGPCNAAIYRARNGEYRAGYCYDGRCLPVINCVVDGDCEKATGDNCSYCDGQNKCYPYTQGSCGSW